ncbi:hypothetical protein STRAU_0026 [Streptomyces aurantiacus JA 4570]|uniref:Uncharacterized protein n=1 Tax=Streptomyces aurantiacus JA 4570 TaxID=1286094 RepID=S4A7U1_9ACTN|nr:hypothetical protein STRAU_0026 [Streptomyces aurantiacus JA 4570]
MELQRLTGVRLGVWLGAPGESGDARAERLEFLADVMLGIDEGERHRAGEKAKAARVAELHRVVLDEPVDGPTLLFRHAHGDPEDWSAADFDAFENIARTTQLSREREREPVVVVEEIPALLPVGHAAAVREALAGVWAA